MMSEQEIAGTINSILLDVFNAINGNHQSDNKSINHSSGFHHAHSEKHMASWRWIG